MTAQLRDIVKDCKFSVPKTREVWIVKDNQIRFIPENNRTFHEYRFVLVAMNAKYCTPENMIINIIPLSSKKQKQDIFVYSVSNKYEDLNSNPQLRQSSSAIINLYQPIDKKYFFSYVGRLDETCYNSIINILSTYLINNVGFDMSPY